MTFDSPTFDSPTFDSMWSAIEPIGRETSTGGYRRHAWTRDDATLREDQPSTPHERNLWRAARGDAA